MKWFIPLVFFALFQLASARPAFEFGRRASSSSSASVSASSTKSVSTSVGATPASSTKSASASASKTSSTSAAASSSTASSSNSTSSSTAAADDVASVGYATLNGGTSGGSGGTSTTVTTLDELTSAVEGSDSKIVIISGTITGNDVVRVGSNTTVLGAAGASLEGVGLRVYQESNVIIRNIAISKVLAEAGDAIGIQEASQVWVDHVDLSSDMDHDKDYYDGLLDITHGSNGVTVTNSKLHDHWKASLVGHSDSNGDEDVAITVTYANNWWTNLNSRTPSFRFGTGHIYNNYYESNNDGINTRDGAQLLVENNVFVSVDKPLYATDEGYAVSNGNDFGDEEDTADTGTFTTAPYDYDMLDATEVAASVMASAGATLSF